MHMQKVVAQVRPQPAHQSGADSELVANTRSGGLQRAKVALARPHCSCQRPRGKATRYQGRRRWLVENRKLDA